MQSGRTCRPIARAHELEPEPFTVKVARDNVLVEFRGRLVRVLTGKAADELRRAVSSGDDAAVQSLVARRTGNFKRGHER